MIRSSDPIGVFDSGIGGLTVVKELIKQLPNENIIYFGDTARVPYGTKSNETILQYSIQNTNFLLSKNVKMIVVACNTSSAVALDEIRTRVNIPIVGVIEPGAESAIKKTRNKKIAVIGTTATITSGAYEKTIKLMDASISVISKACPLFVPIVEEGWANHKIAKLAAEEYLNSILKNNFDTLILGCTHYPLLQNTIQQVIGEGITIVDSGRETAKKVKFILEKNGLLNRSNHKPNYVFYVSDLPQKFIQIGEMFLEQKIENLYKIYLEDELKKIF